MVLKGQQSRNEIEVGFFKIEAPLKSSPNDKILPSSKDGEYTYSNQLINLETKFFCDILGSFAVWRNNATNVHLPHA